MPATASIEVRNPSFQPGHPQEIERVVVERSLRNDPLGRLHACRRIGDAEYHAARELQGLLEAAEVGHVRSIDFSADPVDGGGRVPDILTERQRRSLRRLVKEIYPVLGKLGSALCQAVLSHGMMPEEYARALGITDAREINSYGREFRRHLEVLAKEFGYAS